MKISNFRLVVSGIQLPSLANTWQATNQIVGLSGRREGLDGKLLQQRSILSADVMSKTHWWD
jgi:hypothetical protein